MNSEKLLNDLKSIREILIQKKEIENKTSQLIERIEASIEEVTESLETFGQVSWNQEDITSILENKDITLNVTELAEIADLADERLRDVMIETGWNVLDDIINDYLDSKEGQ